MRYVSVLLCVFALQYSTLANATDRVVLQLRWDHQFQFAGYYAALWKGYYESAGLDVEIRSAITPEKTILKPSKEVRNGRAHFGIVGADVLIKRQEGYPSVIVASIFQSSASAYFSLPASGVSSPADLVGLTIASRPGTLVHFELEDMLLREGIDSSVLKIIQTRPGIGQLLSGEAQVLGGYILSDPWLAREAGVQLSELRPFDHSVKFYGDTLVTSEAVISGNPDMVERFLDATLKGWGYALENPDEIAAGIASKLDRAIPVDNLLDFNLFQAEKVRELMLYPIVRVGNTNPNRWRMTFEHLKEHGLVAGEFVPDEWIFDPRIRVEEREKFILHLLKYGAPISGLVILVLLIWTWTLRRSVDFATKAFAKSEEQYRSLVETQPELVCRYFPDTTLTFVNIAYAKLFHRLPEELIGSKWLDFLSEMDRADALAHCDSVTSENPASRYEHMILGADGAPRWYLWNTQAFFDDAGHPIAFQSVGTDITDRKEVEAALFDQKERAQVTLHSIGDAVITSDANGIVEYLNPIAEKLTGWTAKDAKGQKLASVFRIIEEETREPGSYPTVRCLEEGGAIGKANHHVLIDRNGHEHPIEDTTAPIRGRRGELLGAVLVFRDVGETRRMARQLAHDAAHDPLTGLINRREFEKRLQSAVLSAKQHRAHNVLCYLDLDQFKLVNDTASHAAGDELLKHVKELLAGKFRQTDTLGRLGGDEFGLLLENCDLEEAQAICEVIVTTIRDYRFNWYGQTFQIGVSIGLVPFSSDTESADQLMSQADVACYSAKELGRNQIHVYQKKGAKLSLRHSEIVVASGLQDALAQNRFLLYCQPIIELSNTTGHRNRHEILLRLLDNGEIILPGSFIPAAERYGLMNAIDHWVIRKAFQSYRTYFGASCGVEIAVNLSGNSLGDDSFFEFLGGQLSTFSVPPSSVCLEITETAVIKNPDKASEILKRIKNMGCKVALDDFGVGLSSFTYLKQFPADYLKIDGSFVRDINRSTVDCAMVEAINQVGHTLGLTTIAEWAQTIDVVERLQKLGVDCAQGNALGAPVPLDEVLSSPDLRQPLVGAA